MNKRDAKNEENPIAKVEVYMPKSMANLLRELSELKNLPMSRLICYAVDNEMVTGEPFTYLFNVPEEDFTGVYTVEGNKIRRYLENFPKGTGRDMLLLCRRDIGIPNKTVFHRAYKELLQNAMIEEIKPPPLTRFKYDANYRYVRIAGSDAAVLRSAKKSRIYSRMKGKL